MMKRESGLFVRNSGDGLFVSSFPPYCPGASFTVLWGVPVGSEVTTRESLTKISFCIE